MKGDAVNMNAQKSILRVLAVTGGLLLIPLIAMQFTGEVKWTGFDFVVMGTLLFVVGILFEFGVRKIQSKQRRIIAAVLLAAAFLYVWAELAVGIFTHLGS